jgi:uncharacterized protein (TIGR03435 family)
MRNLVLAIPLALCLPAFSQTSTFDVASIKAAPPLDGHFIRMGMTGGPGTKDPTRLTCENCTLTMMLLQAYDIQPYQLNAPGWMNSERYEISAKIPEGATKDQFRQMLQNLLAERFHVKVHKDSKESQVYDLTVAKGGPKFKETAEAPPVGTGGAADASDGQPKLPAITQFNRLNLDSNGCPVFPSGGPVGNAPRTMVINGKACVRAEGQTMEQLSKMLSNQLGKPVTDTTGLKGKYDFNMTFAAENTRGGPLGTPGQATMVFRTVGPGGGGGGEERAADTESAPTLFAALQSQLGLKLEQKKGLIDVIVVDSGDKTPTEN